MATAAAITVKAANIATIIGMINRGDRHHDIAAWFGLVVGRLAKDPLTGRRLKPDAMAIENPAGFRIERLETGMGGSELMTIAVPVYALLWRTSARTSKRRYVDPRQGSLAHVRRATFGAFAHGLASSAGSLRPATEVSHILPLPRSTPT